MKDLNLDALSAYLRGRADIVCAVVFGSAQEGRVGDESDLDLGVYFDPRPDTETLLQFLADVAAAVEFDEIDYTDLRNADPILAFEAVSGRWVCKNDPDKTAEYVSLVCREYEDVAWRLSHAA